MKQFDYKTDMKNLYGTGPKAPVLVNVPELRFLMIDGAGDPNGSQTFQEAMDALFSVSYTAKFTLKMGPSKIDYSVMPVEGLWWADDMNAFLSGDKSKWKWTMMIAQPDCLPEDALREAIEVARKKKPLPAIDRMRIERFAEGRAAQILHVGPFTAEGPTVVRLHDFIAAQGLQRRDKHHEIYLSDTRRAAPEKWRTLIRQPVQ
jgi:hypothetical protein